jgi:16S rRNA (cytidine1402-2'-O)-methyltransferase
MNDKSDSNGSLYLVATPIGNLKDITLRALEVLASVQLIAAEDTRHTRKLLSAHDIKTPLMSYREQNHASAARRMLRRLRAGDDVALVSDAGTPGISDPGQAMVAAAVEQGIKVVPVPGPSAVVAALAASGLPTDQFLFIGFLPRKAGALRALIEKLSSVDQSLVFYESPRRLGKTLDIMAGILGPRQAVVVRELTKVHEEFDRGTLEELANRYRLGARGEVTLVVAPADRDSAEVAPALAAPAGVIRALHAGKRLSAAEIARLLGLKRSEVYAQLIRDKEEEHS